MRWAAESGEWWCAHCHHRVDGSRAQELAAATRPPAPTAPSAPPPAVRAQAPTAPAVVEPPGSQRFQPPTAAGWSAAPGEAGWPAAPAQADPPTATLGFRPSAIGEPAAAPTDEAPVGPLEVSTPEPAADDPSDTAVDLVRPTELETAAPDPGDAGAAEPPAAEPPAGAVPSLGDVLGIPPMLPPGHPYLQPGGATRPPPQPRPRPPGRRLWPAVVAIVLAAVAIAVVAAVALFGPRDRAGSNDEVILRVLPRDTTSVRGVHWSALGHGRLGHALAELFSPETDWLTGAARACGRPVEESLDWMALARPRGDRLGEGTMLFGLRWDEDRVHSCARSLAEHFGVGLQVRADGDLRVYDFGDDRTVLAAWLDDHTVLVSQAWESDRQREVLEELSARRAPDPDNREIGELVERVDTGATLWAAMLRPLPDDDGSPGDDRWLGDEIAGLLGAWPEAIYASVDVGDAVRVTAGARYATEDRASRVARHAADYLALRKRDGDVAQVDLSNYPPAMRRQIEQMLAVTGGAALRAALLDAVRVDHEGRYVTFTIDLPASRIDDLLANQTPRDLIDEINAWLPESLRIAP